MSKLRYYLVFLLVIIPVIAVMLAGKPNMIKAENGGAKIVYYAGFAGYTLPFKPIEEISNKEIENRISYCIGYYDDYGKLYRFEKYVNGKLFFRHNYKYYDNGRLRENTGINPDGEQIIQRFDKDGRLIENE